MTQKAKCLPAMWETQVRSPDWEGLQRRKSLKTYVRISIGIIITQEAFICSLDSVVIGEKIKVMKREEEG